MEAGLISTTYPSVLHMHKGSLLLSAWKVMPRCSGTEIANDSGEVFATPKGVLAGYGPCSNYGGDSWDLRLLDGYQAARSARFEHGESGYRVGRGPSFTIIEPGPGGVVE